MQSATLSSKFQISIPKQIREEMHLKAGQEFIFITKGEVLYLVPKKNLKELRGIVSNTNIENYRDRKDRV